MNISTKLSMIISISLFFLNIALLFMVKTEREDKVNLEQSLLTSNDSIKQLENLHDILLLNTSLAFELHSKIIDSDAILFD
ncbi:MAG: hypothetical protein EPN88_18180 [Bacteroidetes bacterium]|nr:MAG: hypothetical protein EPN88_18180 [Bacteroidota bacterium]